MTLLDTIPSSLLRAAAVTRMYSILGVFLTFRHLYHELYCHYSKIAEFRFRRRYH